MQADIQGYIKWKKIFLFCLGIAIAAGFCMKWMEPDLIANNKVFTVIGLELGYPKEKIEAILQGMDPSVKQVLNYHLCFDFMFMVGVFPGVAALLMMARNKSSNGTIRKFLLWLAILQLLAWACDITENIWLLTWMKNGIADQLQAFRFLVIGKWILVCMGILTGSLIFAKKFLNGTNQKI